MINWQDLAATSPYQTALAVERELRNGNVSEAKTGMQELIEALSRSDKRALKSHLIRLMVHIIKWNTQTDKRNRSWRATINNARREIAEIQEDTPSLNQTVIESMWDNCFASAKEEAEGEMNQESAVESLSWQDVFETEYELG